MNYPLLIEKIAERLRPLFLRPDHVHAAVLLTDILFKEMQKTSRPLDLNLPVPSLRKQFIVTRANCERCGYIEYLEKEHWTTFTDETGTWEAFIDNRSDAQMRKAANVVIDVFREEKLFTRSDLVLKNSARADAHSLVKNVSNFVNWHLFRSSTEAILKTMQEVDFRSIAPENASIILNSIRTEAFHTFAKILKEENLHLPDASQRVSSTLGTCWNTLRHAGLRDIDSVHAFLSDKKDFRSIARAIARKTRPSRDPKYPIFNGKTFRREAACILLISEVLCEFKKSNPPRDSFSLQPCLASQRYNPRALSAKSHSSIP
ncbi:MAG: hypothetical protein ACOY3I_09985 [Verrucomicrobiota bacterium]